MYLYIRTYIYIHTYSSCINCTRPVWCRSRQSDSARDPPGFTKKELEVVIAVNESAQCLVVVFKL